MRRALLLVGMLMMQFAGGPVLAQDVGQITGTVIESHLGTPLQGVTVEVVGTSLVGITDASGRYTIRNAPVGSVQLSTTMLGHTPVSRSVTVVGDQTTTIDFELEPQAIALEGVVVVGYGAQQRRDVTGSVASVSADEIHEIPTPNVVDALKGRVPGVDVVATGYAPGAGVRVRVRGQRSIVADNEPLYVVDGIPLPGGIQDINPHNIQSVEILKDASATAIYGSRGANGVVLITTDAGRLGQAQFTYDGYAGIQTILNPVDMMNGPEYAEFRREAWRNFGPYEEACPGWTACEAGDLVAFDPEELASIANGTWSDYPALISRNGVQQSHRIGAQGGDERTRFSASFDHFAQEGVTRGTGYNRQVGSFSITHSAGRLLMGGTTHVSRSIQELSRGDELWESAHTTPPLGAYKDDEGRPILTPTRDQIFQNPLLDIENWVHDIERTRVFGSLFAELELVEGITWRVNFGPDMTFVRDGQFRGAQTSANRDGPADAYQIRDEVFAYTLDNLITVRREFSEHVVDFTGLYSIQQERRERSQASVEELPYEHQLFHNLGSAALVEGVGSELQEWSLQSYMGRLNYSFQDKYLLTLTGRMDGSSRLAARNKYALFPSIAIAWQLGAEPFLANLGVFSNLKVRASWGRTGNTAIAPYQTLGSLRRTEYRLGEVSAFGYGPDDLTNAELEWERTEQFDIGIDFGVLNNRIAGTVDLYLANTKDLLLERQLPEATGYSSILQNIGETQNRGIELGLSTINFEDWHGIRWTTDLNFALNRNKIVRLFGELEDDVGNLWFIGQPIQVWYDHEFDGIWQLDEAEEAARYGQQPGDIRVVDQNNDGQINADDRVIKGTPFPKWTAGLTNRIEWGGFDLSTFLTTRQGSTIYDDFISTRNNLHGRHNNLAVEYWTPDNPSNINPRPNRGRGAQPIYNSSRAHVDGSFVRVRNLTLGYKPPARLFSRVGAESIRIYASAQNPFLFTDYIGFDPESGTGSVMPSYRTILIGATVRF